LQRDFEFEYIINLFEQRLKSYKNPELQQKIKEIIPKRTEGLNSEQYVKLLLKWYKKEYFSWCNKPKCPKCGQNDKNLTIVSYKGKPNESELKYLAYKTEVYICNNCQLEVRFPRCNNPIILLETRTGRCSEWSNLFGAILYTCGFKVRLINNFEDHVWNEFYNEEEQRWIHLDSCEQAYDTPLVYEQGWGRVMTFILGMSDDGLVEVTPRYVKDWKIISERRSEKMEIKLGNILEDVNKKMTCGISQEEKNNIENRRKNEIKDFEEKIKKDMMENNLDNNGKIKDEEKIGRQSGSLEWRKNRGEC
jgi:peptide-N4-(N-acetyl-beta-glucosaminyl)asparagine amidase